MKKAAEQTDSSPQKQSPLAGLKIEAEMDANRYPKSLRVPDEERRKINIYEADFHGDWNYTILPSP